MKKSQFIKEFAEYLCIDEKTAEVMVDAALHVGMLPPSYLVNSNMERINPVAVPSESTYLIERRWEPENE